MDLLTSLYSELETLLEDISDRQKKAAGIQSVIDLYSKKGEEMIDLFAPAPQSSGKVAIPYMQEARTFLAEWNPNNLFKIGHFKSYLNKKYGMENVHDQSMRGPFPRLLKEGAIYISMHGDGNSGHSYRISIPGQPNIIRQRSVYPMECDVPDDDRDDFHDDK